MWTWKTTKRSSRKKPQSSRSQGQERRKHQAARRQEEAVHTRDSLSHRRDRAAERGWGDAGTGSAPGGNLLKFLRGPELRQWPQCGPQLRISSPSLTTTLYLLNLSFVFASWNLTNATGVFSDVLFFFFNLVKGLPPPWLNLTNRI